MPKNPPALLHAILAFAALCGISVLIAFTGASQSAARLRAGPAEHISIEPNHPFRLSIAIAQGPIPGIFDISHDSSDAVFITVPQSWSLREVRGRGSSLSDIPDDPPALNSHRFLILSGTTLSFFTTNPTTLVLHNVTSIPIQVEWKRVNLQSGKVIEDTALVKEKPLEF